eukprot:463526_1
MTAIIYIILLCISSILFIVLWTFIMHQFCTTKVKRIERVFKTSLLALLATLSVFLNVSTYLAFILPDYAHISDSTLWVVSNLLEVTVLILGFYLFSMFQMSIICDMYTPINMKPPKWIKPLFNAIQFTYFFTVLFFFSFVYLFKNVIWIWRFYFVLSSVTFIQALIVFCVLRRLLKIFKNIDRCNMNDAKLKKAQHAIRIAMIVVIALCFVSLVCGCFALEYTYHYLPLDFDHILLYLVLHSLFLLLVIIALFLWIYKDTKWCFLNRKSTVCDVWGCGAFWAKCCDECCCCNCQHNYHFKSRQHKVFDAAEMLLNEPTVMTVNPHSIGTKSSRTPEQQTAKLCV